MARGATLGGVLQQSRVACMARLPSATSHRLQLFPPTNILTRCKMVEEGRLFRKRQRTLSGHRQTLCQLTSGSATCALEPPRSARRFQWGTAPAPIACSLRFFQYTRTCTSTKTCQAVVKRLTKAIPFYFFRTTLRTTLRTLRTLRTTLRKKKTARGAHRLWYAAMQHAAVLNAGAGARPAVLFRRL